MAVDSGVQIVVVLPRVMSMFEGLPNPAVASAPNSGLFGNRWHLPAQRICDFGGLSGIP